MEKTLTIDGRQVRFKSTGATPLRYKAQFGKDYFSELMKFLKLEGVLEGNVSALETFDFEGMYEIVWMLAKTADQEIPEPLVWLDDFDEFPVLEIFTELQDLIMKSLQSSKKK